MNNKLLRIASTVLIGVGIAFLCYYIFGSGKGDLSAFSYPSYYLAQNRWVVFLAGIGTLLSSLIGSFFAWFHKMDADEDVLPNAVTMETDEITSLVGGSTLDTEVNN